MQEIPIPTLLDSEECLPSYGSELAAGADVGPISKTTSC